MVKAIRTVPLSVWKRYGIILSWLFAMPLVSSRGLAQELPGRFLKRAVISSPNNFQQRIVRSFPDTVRVLAIMVDFQTDTDSRTTGNGTFALLPSSDHIIDPSPHDSTFFAYKLHFLENYFRKCSNGKQIVKGEVFGQRITLSKQMASYSPSASNKPIADMVVESWRKADSLYPAIPFSKYNAFVIFHAGVGRDIDLVSLLGFDPTPSDIPSLYLGLPTLKAFLNDPAFPGISVKNGSTRITNTIIMPETESRVINSGGSVDSLLLGVNGLLASSMGNFLGLPDLFNTSTGQSAIGQFGLMDVASIFGFNGLFPPEPSAWEKIYLGWVDPIVVSSGTQTVTVPAVGLDTTGIDSVYKVPISSKEYFLLENRNRDPKRDGQHVKVVQSGSVSTLFFPKDTTGFSNNDARQAWGSVIDVEDFDWALPGVFSSDETLEGGGILIWHIDENTISQNIASDKVNADPNHRGVALEEADGSFDIGQRYGIFDAGLGSEFGSPFDCWYQQNPTQVYRNIFDANSFPNSKSNSGAASSITVKNFSKRSPRMTATIQVGDTKFQRLSQFSRSLATTTVATSPTVSPSGAFVGNGSAVYAFQRNGLSKVGNSSGLLSAKGGQWTLAELEQGNGQDLIVGAQDSSVYIWQAQDVTSDGVYDSVKTFILPLNRKISTAPTFADAGLKKSIFVGSEGGSVWQISFDGKIEREITSAQLAVSSLTQLPTPSLSKPTQLFSSGGGRIFSEQLSFKVGDDAKPWLLASTSLRNSNVVLAAQLGGTSVVAVDQALSSIVFQANTPTDGITALAAADIDGDGYNDLILSAGRKLFVLNKSGAAVDGYPVLLPGAGRLSGSPLVADVDGDGKADVVCMTTDGTVLAYDDRGKLKEGFPLQGISSGQSSAALFQTANNKLGLLLISTSGEMQAWEFAVTYNSNLASWPQQFHDAQHTNSQLAIAPSLKPKSSDFFPKSQAYNWPNPVYGNSTQIRYFVSENASITVKIFDLAGSKITEWKSQAVGGIDNETTWDVSGIQSGVYLAHLEASSGTKTESTVIKIAVLK